MHKFTVVITAEVEADTVEEAALLMYQGISKWPPLQYSVTDESKSTTVLVLDRKTADEFASVDHTADPGNW
ncbi:hypothetical protein [Mesorhizobium sp. KR2-14]|uniref:hypothetical protein n=1 Tax=Mesorhizobium sp. KR2-14 TaxID=3156610 RepID=UPI0032B6149C